MAKGWREKYKEMEVAYMVLRDQYAELAVAVGATPLPMWGDPQEGHQEIVAMAKALKG